jgi:hypothetical protein
MIQRLKDLNMVITFECFPIAAAPPGVDSRWLVVPGALPPIDIIERVLGPPKSIEPGLIPDKGP